MTNHTGGEIQFTTMHTGKTYTIPARATRTVPHTEGQIVVTGPQREVWTYDGINVPSFYSETKKGTQRLTLPVSVESDGTIVLPSGRKFIPKKESSKPPPPPKFVPGS